MENMYDKAYELAELIKRSPQCEQYQKIKKEVYADDNNRRMLDDFRQMQFEAHAKLISGEEPDAELTDKLQKLGQVLQSNPQITEYFAAEYTMQTIASDMFKIIADACDLATPEMQE